MFIALENEKTKTIQVVLQGDGFWVDDSVIEQVGLDPETFWKIIHDGKDDQVTFHTHNKLFIGFIERGGRMVFNIFKLILGDGRVRDWMYVGVLWKKLPMKVAKKKRLPKASRYRVTFRRINNLKVIERYNEWKNK